MSIKTYSRFEDGRRATHVSGLVVTYDGQRATVDLDSVEMMRQQMVNDLGGDWHFGAELYELTAQAVRLFALRMQH